MRKRSTVVAWSMLAVYVASVSVSYHLMVTNGIFQDDPANQLGLLLTFTAFLVVGAVIVARRPDNTIGWIFSAIGLVSVWGAPASGASMNPARSLGPELIAGGPHQLLDLPRRPDHRRDDRRWLRVHPQGQGSQGWRRSRPGGPRRGR